MRRRRCGVCERLDPGHEIEALYVTPHLARSLHYTASLIDRAAESECAAWVLERLGLRGVRNIDGVPHLLPKGGAYKRRRRRLGVCGRGGACPVRG